MLLAKNLIPWSYYACVPRCQPQKTVKFSWLCNTDWTNDSKDVITVSFASLSLELLKFRWVGDTCLQPWDKNMGTFSRLVCLHLSKRYAQNLSHRHFHFKNLSRSVVAYTFNTGTQGTEKGTSLSSRSACLQREFSTEKLCLKKKSEFYFQSSWFIIFPCVPHSGRHRLFVLSPPFPSNSQLLGRFDWRRMKEWGRRAKGAGGIMKVLLVSCCGLAQVGGSGAA